MTKPGREPLRAAAAPGCRRVLTYEMALRHAVRVFVRDGGLDMKTLAEEIPVGRATLYRVVASRDQLLGDVLWVLAERTLRRAQEEAQASDGVERVLEISRRFKELTLGFPPLRTFLQAEPQTGLRVLLTPAARVSERIAEAWVEIFRDLVERDQLTLPFDLEWFAYVFVRTGESMTYSDLLSGRDPDLDVATYVQRALFSGVRSPSQPD